MVLLDSNKVNEQHSSQTKHSRCFQVVRQIISGLKCPGVMTGNIRKFIIKMFSSAVLYYFLTIFNKANFNVHFNWRYIFVLGRHNRISELDCLQFIQTKNGLPQCNGPKIIATFNQPSWTPAFLIYELLTTNNDTIFIPFTELYYYCRN